MNRIRFYSNQLKNKITVCEEVFRFQFEIDFESNWKVADAEDLKRW